MIKKTAKNNVKISQFTVQCKSRL